ncbi:MULTISPECIES: hypothetical protein [Methylosinus]|uniref:hypothetical protein n=1 Tax=Methylosinus TaxID=425 RepID=UPI00058D1D46|nr:MULTISPECIES: hypothetical protein [Methylosinus]OBS51804.1 hypothetical protein A8B73_14185 [Methylosinus sp. 3S-1]
MGDRLDHALDLAHDLAEPGLRLRTLAAGVAGQAAPLLMIGSHEFGDQLGLVDLRPQRFHDSGLDPVEIIGSMVVAAAALGRSAAADAWAAVGVVMLRHAGPAGAAAQ